MFFRKAAFLALLLMVPVCMHSQDLDIRLLRDINLHRSQGLDPVMKSFSNTTTLVCVAVPVSILTYSIIKKDSLKARKALVLCASAATAGVLSYTIKHIVNRTRPFISYPDLKPQVSVNSSSFPSGHTTNSFALATSLSLAYPKWYVIAPSYLWASSVAYSRMHLGVHYPSDVLAGAIIGAGSSYVCYKLNKILFKRVSLF